MGRVECTDAGVTLAEQGPQVEDQLLRHRPRLKKPPSGGSNFGAASASPPSRFERLTSLKPPALPGDIYSCCWLYSYPQPGRILALYPVHPRRRKSLGEIIRKLSVTESHISAHRLGTSSRRKTRVAAANSPRVWYTGQRQKLGFFKWLRVP